MSGRPLGEARPWPAPGKLNLFLHVTGRRPDGYHLLQTAFQFIDLADEIRLWERPPGIVEQVSAHPHVPPDLDLSLRAARLLMAHADVSRGVGIELAKRLPIQGGVGGGSSDAATTLVALNEIWGTGWSDAELAELGLELGADVPVFIGGRAAWAEGVGERLTPVDFPQGWYVLIRPDAAVSTAEIFKASELTRDSPVITIRDFLESGGRNDCTAVVRGRYRAVAEALDWLARYADARLTGTGACVFGAVPDEGAGHAVLARLPSRWHGYLVRGLNESPRADRLRHEQAGGSAD